MASKSKTNAKAKPAKAAKPPVTIYPSRDIPLNLLQLSDANVRTIFDDAEIAALAEDIAARSLLQGMNVRPIVDDSGKETGRFEIPAGGRRFRALQLLVKQNRLPADTPVPCVIKTDGIAEDDSLAENTFREKLHPLDEFMAFAKIVAAGRTEEDAAAAYGVTTTYVKQRLKLAAADPILHKAYRDDEINLGQLEAFCITDDKKRQKEVFKALFKSNGHHNTGAYSIRQLLIEKTVPADDKRVKFVGLDAYKKAGGVIISDLFSEHDECFLQDAALLNKLVQEKFDKLRAKHLKDGWKWATAVVDINTIDRKGWDKLMPPPHAPDVEEKIAALEAERDRLYDKDNGDDEAADQADSERLDAIDAELEQLDVERPFTPEQLATAGVLIHLDWNGKPQILTAQVLPEDKKAANATTPETANGHTNGHAANGKQPGGLSMALIGELSSSRTVALQNATANDFPTAFLAMVHLLALNHFYHHASASCVQLQKRDTSPLTGEAAKDWAPTKALAKRDAEWKKQLPDSYAELWDALLAMEDSTLRALFAHCVAMSINAVQTQFGGRECIRHSGQLATALGMHMVTAGWAPTVENYLGRVSKPLILEAVREAKGDEHTQHLNGAKKTEMAAAAQQLLQGTGWLPQILRTPEPQTDAPAADPDAIPAFLADTAEESRPAA